MIFATAFNAIEQVLFETDWAEARARLGEKATASDLSRTPQQRRADALVEMAIRASTAPKDGRRPAPLFTVMVGLETLVGRILELANGTVTQANGEMQCGFHNRRKGRRSPPSPHPEDGDPSDNQT